MTNNRQLVTSNRQTSHWYRETNFFAILKGSKLGKDNRTSDPDRECKPYLLHFVRFKSTYGTATIRAIEVRYYSNDKIEVSFIPAANLETQLNKVCNIFAEKDLELCTSRLLGVKIHISSEDTAKRVIGLLQLLNEKYQQKEFTEDLMQDLEKIFVFKQLSDQDKYHQVPFGQPDKKQQDWFFSNYSGNNLWVNRETNPLLHYLVECEWNREIFNMEIFIKLLKAAHDPNEMSHNGLTVLKFAMDDAKSNQNEGLVKTALFYNANPFDLVDKGYVVRTHIELAYDFNQTSVVQLMLQHSAQHFDFNILPFDETVNLTFVPARVEKPLYKMLSFETIASELKLPQMTTYFYFKTNENETLKTKTNEIQFRVTASSGIDEQLREKFRQLIYPSYSQHFEPSIVIEHDLMEFFNSEYVGKSKYIEDLFVNGRFVGNHLLEIIRDPHFPDTIFFHISCIFMNAAERGKGLTNPLVFSLALALQMLYSDKNNDKKVICAFQAISYGSANLVKNLHYFPKYQGYYATLPPFLIEHMERKPSKVVGPLLIDNCYSPIEVQNKETQDKQTQDKKDQDKDKQTADKKDQDNDAKKPQKSSASINLEFFEGMRGTKPNSAHNKHCGVMIIFGVTEELLLEFARLCWQMNIDPMQLLRQRAFHLAKLLNQESEMQNGLPIFSVPDPAKLKLFVSQHEALFTSGKRVPIDADEFLKSRSL